MWQLAVQQLAESPFLATVLFQNESGFGTDDINFQNHHQRADDNTHGVLQPREQQFFIINIWAGVVGDNLVDQHVLLS